MDSIDFNFSHGAIVPIPECARTFTFSRTVQIDNLPWKHLRKILNVTLTILFSSLPSNTLLTSAIEWELCVSTLLLNNVELQLPLLRLSQQCFFVTSYFAEEEPLPGSVKMTHWDTVEVSGIEHVTFFLFFTLCQILFNLWDFFVKRNIFPELQIKS